MCVYKKTPKCQYIHFLEEKVLAGTSRANLLCLLQGEESLIPSCSAGPPWTRSTTGAETWWHQPGDAGEAEPAALGGTGLSLWCAGQPTKGCRKQSFVCSTRYIREVGHPRVSLCPCNDLRDGRMWAWMGRGGGEDVFGGVFRQFTAFSDLQEMDFFSMCCSSQLFHQQFREWSEKLVGSQMTSVVL